MDTLKKFRAEQMALEMYIYVFGIGFTIYTGMLCFGFRAPLAEWVSLTCGFLLMSGGAWMYRLCWLSYVTIAYIYIIRCCMILKEFDMFKDYLTYAYLAAFFLGLLLCTLIAYKIIRNRHEKTKTALQNTDQGRRKRA